METLTEFSNWMAVIVNIAILILGGYVLWKKAPPEIQKIRSESISSEGDAAESFANATKIYAEELKAVRVELKDLRKQVDEKDAEIKRIIESKDKIIIEREKIILEQKTVIADLTDWAERLVHQVRSLGGVDPVPLRMTKKE